MKRLFFLLFLFSHFSSGQTISCSGTVFPPNNYDFIYTEKYVNMNSANTPIMFKTKPKGMINFYTMALGNPVTNIPENYAVVFDPSNSDDEWDAWISTTPVGHPNRNTFHIQGRFKTPNYNFPGNAGDMINFFITGVPSNNDGFPTPHVMTAFPLVQWGSTSTFLDSVVVDDILAGDTATVEIGTLSRGTVEISDSYGSTSKINMPTDNPNVTIDITSPMAFNYENKIQTNSSTLMEPMENNRDYPVVATIKTNSNATGKYTKTVTMTVLCP
ncbi:hypothetical protein ACVADT_001625 [Escherichia coli]